MPKNKHRFISYEYNNANKSTHSPMLHRKIWADSHAKYDTVDIGFYLFKVGTLHLGFAGRA